MDDLTFRHRAVDHPGSMPCPHCGGIVTLPATEPWVVVNGIAAPPECLESLRCPYCRRRMYLQPVTDEQKAWDADHDALEDESES